ncbi:hypothetical protein ACLB2K_045532 [Fragaria x ananassa]
MEQVIKDLFPNAKHRHCVRHLHNNFKGDGHTGLELKQRLWAVARATTMNEYTKTMGEMAAASGSAYNWCMDRPVKHWSRSHFGWMLKCDILLNNHTIYSKGWSLDDYVAEWYTKKKYMQAYQVMLHPIAGVSEWEPIERKIAPPLYRRQPGRPKKNRTKGLGETTPPLGTEKLPRSFYSRVSCGTCNQRGHNARSCARRNQVVNENVRMEQENVQEQVPQQNPVQVEAPNEGPQEYEAPLPYEESNFQDAYPREAQKDLQGGLSLDSHLGLLQNLAQALRMFDS